MLSSPRIPNGNQDLILPAFVPQSLFGGSIISHAGDLTLQWDRVGCRAPFSGTHKSGYYVLHPVSLGLTLSDKTQNAQLHLNVPNIL